MTEPSPHVVPTQAGYDRWSAIYDREDNPVILLEQRHLGELLGSVDGCDVLDVGCGTGRHSIPLAQAGVRVTGLDFSEGMLARARAKAAACAGSVELRFLNHDLAQPLPVPDRSFDLVLCSLVLEHLRDLDAFFKELARACRPSAIPSS